MTDRLNHCPLCGREVILKEYYESTDGRSDEFAKIKCECGLELKLTFDEFYQVKKDFNYRGGYYSSNKEFWNGMHQRLIEKWNTRKPMDRIENKLIDAAESGITIRKSGVTRTAMFVEIADAIKIIEGEL